MAGDMVEGKGFSEGQVKDWMVPLEENLTEFGMQFAGCQAAAEQADTRFGRVEHGAETFNVKMEWRGDM